MKTKIKPKIKPAKKRYTDAELDLWERDTRRRFHRGLLSQEEIQLCKAVGFDFKTKK